MGTTRAKYIGTTGIHPILGYSVNGEEKEIPDEEYDNLKDIGHIQDIQEDPKPAKKYKRSNTKEE